MRPWVRTPTSDMGNKSLPAWMRCWIALSSHCRGANGMTCHPSIDRIAELTRLTPRGVRLGLRQLERMGRLKTEDGGGRHRVNHYRLVMETGNDGSDIAPETLNDETLNRDDQKVGNPERSRPKTLNGRSPGTRDRNEKRVRRSRATNNPLLDAVLSTHRCETGVQMTPDMIHGGFAALAATLKRLANSVDPPLPPDEMADVYAAYRRLPDAWLRERRYPVTSFARNFEAAYEQVRQPAQRNSDTKAPTPEDIALFGGMK